MLNNRKQIACLVHVLWTITPTPPVVLNGCDWREMWLSENTRIGVKRDWFILTVIVQRAPSGKNNTVIYWMKTRNARAFMLTVPVLRSSSQWHVTDTANKNVISPRLGMSSVKRRNTQSTISSVKSPSISQRALTVQSKCFRLKYLIYTVFTWICCLCKRKKQDMKINRFKERFEFVYFSKTFPEISNKRL